MPLKILNDGLISGVPRVGKDGTVTFGEKITRELFDPLTKSTSKQTGYGGIKKAYVDAVKKFLKKNKIKLSIWIQDLWPESIIAASNIQSKNAQKLLNILVKFIYKKY